MIFADYAELKTAKDQLKNELKTKVTNAFEDISVECFYRVYDIWGHVLDITRPLFQKFTKGHKEEWCNKVSLLFETAFDSVLKVVYETTQHVNVEDLHFFIDDFFDKDELFDEDWFLCSKCFKSTDYYDEAKDTVMCMVCDNSA
jgi:hypothetical protein